MGFFSNNSDANTPLEPVKDNAPWLDAVGVAGQETPSTRYNIEGLPLDMYACRDVSSWKALGLATVTGDDFSQYQIEFHHAADGEAAGQRPNVRLIRDGATLFELTLENGEMHVYKGSTSKFTKNTKMAKLDFDQGFFTNTWKLFNDGSKTACIEVDSKSLDHKTEYKMDGKVIARLLSDSSIEVAAGTDALKVLAVYLCQWWYHVNDQCGPTGELAGTPSGLVA